MKVLRYFKLKNLRINKAGSNSGSVHPSPVKGGGNKKVLGGGTDLLRPGTGTDRRLIRRRPRASRRYTSVRPVAAAARER